MSELEAEFNQLYYAEAERRLRMYLHDQYIGEYFAPGVTKDDWIPIALRHSKRNKWRVYHILRQRYSS